MSKHSVRCAKEWLRRKTLPSLKSLKNECGFCLERPGLLPERFRELENLLRFSFSLVSFSRET